MPPTLCAKSTLGTRDLMLMLQWQKIEISVIHLGTREVTAGGPLWARLLDSTLLITWIPLAPTLKGYSGDALNLWVSMSAQTLCLVVVQSLICVWVLATQWTAAHQASLCSAIFPEQTCTQINGHWLCWGRIEGTALHMYLPCLSGSFLPETQSMASRSEHWLRYAQEVKGRDFGLRRSPRILMLLCLTLIYLILVLVIGGKQYPTHVQVRIQAKIQNDSYADSRNSNSRLYCNVAWKVTSPLPLGTVSVSWFPRTTELCLRSERAFWQNVHLLCIFLFTTTADLFPWCPMSDSRCFMNFGQLSHCLWWEVKFKHGCSMMGRRKLCL